MKQNSINFKVGSQRLIFLTMRWAMTRLAMLRWASVLWLLSFAAIMHSVHTQASTKGYEQWKAEQLQHDQRLKQKYQVKTMPPTPVAAVPKVPLASESALAIAIPNESKAEMLSAKQQILGTKVSVNINTATAQELAAKLEGIGEKKAQAILAHRKQHGRFKQVDDLLEVKGIGIKTLDKNRERIRVN